MEKKEFKKHIENCMSRFGQTMKIGDVYLNDGFVYNPRVNKGRGTAYLAVRGRTPLERTTDVMWTHAKREGQFVVNKEVYSLSKIGVEPNTAYDNINND